MAKEQVILTWCDRHLSEKDEQVKGDTYTWGKQNVDLCEECAGPLVEARQLFDTFGAVGSRTKAPKKQSGEVDPHTCPVCGMVAKNRSALGSHGRSQHSMSIGEMEGKELPYTCDVCQRGFSTPQGAAAHRARSHPDAESA